MNQNLAITEGPGKAANTGGLPLFDQIARGFLKELANRRNKESIPSCAQYLDGKENIDGTFYTRRLVVLAVEDLKQPIEAPLPLCGKAAEQMGRLKLGPIPKLVHYRELATAILRIDAALQLTKAGKAGWQPIYH
jgi:hypothetical protein